MKVFQNKIRSSHNKVGQIETYQEEYLQVREIESEGDLVRINKKCE